MHSTYRITLTGCLLAMLLVLSSGSVRAQVDTLRGPAVDTGTGHFHMQKSPTLALLLSTALPGAGEVYVNQWWKVPLYWGAIGGFLYGAYLQNTRYHYISDSVVNQTNRGDLDLANRYANVREFYRDDRDKYYIYAGIAYIANILDAYISANLFDFDVSDTGPAPNSGSSNKFESHFEAEPTTHVRFRFTYHF